MVQQAELTERLRQRLIGELHLGRSKGGDRLASIREISREQGVDHRVVARAYQELEAEGLVEVRGRSGVYVAHKEVAGGTRVAERSRWLAEVLVEAWTRRVGLPELPALLRAATAPLECVCVESTEDHMLAFCAELEDDFGLSVQSVWLLGGEAENEEKLREAAAHTALLVTTAFHAPLVSRVAAAVGKPVIVVAVNPALTEAIMQRLRSGPVVVVVADLRFADRISEYLRELSADTTRFRVLLAGDPAAREALHQPENALFTRAARRHLGEEEFHLLGKPLPFLAPESARRIAEYIIAYNTGNGAVS